MGEVVREQLAAEGGVATLALVGGVRLKKEKKKCIAQLVTKRNFIKVRQKNKKETHIRKRGSFLLGGDVATEQGQAAIKPAERHRAAAAGLTAVLVKFQRRDGNDAGHRVAINDAVRQGVFELPGAGAEVDPGEARQAKDAEAISTKGGVAQGHAVRLAAKGGDVALLGEPLGGRVDQRAGSEGQRHHLLLLDVSGHGRTDVGQPIVQELDQGHLVVAAEAFEGRVDRQLLGARLEAVELRLLTTDGVTRLVHGPVTGKKKRKVSFTIKMIGKLNKRSEEARTRSEFSQSSILEKKTENN